MKILILAPLKRKMGPNITASRPRMVFDLVSGLVKRGHQVSILGTGKSKVEGVKLLPVIPKGFIEMGPYENPFDARVAFLTKMAKILEKISHNFDIIHNHTRPEFFNLLVEKNIKTPIVTTIHTQYTPELDETLSLFKQSHLICISNPVRKLFKKAKIYKVIHNGVDTNLYKFQPKKDNYLLWIGRLGRAKDKQGKFMDVKGVRWAIKLAKATNSKLLLAGNVEDMEFYNRDVKPHLCKKIKWVGPISEEQPLSKKQIAKLMAKAKVFLMPINWQEAFGLVMAEAQSCGTPVIGFDRGSVRELVKHGKTGFVVKPSAGLVSLKKALSKIDKIKPLDCRQHIEKNFSLDKMVNNYEKTYQQILNKQKT